MSDETRALDLDAIRARSDQYRRMYATAGLDALALAASKSGDDVPALLVEVERLRAEHQARRGSDVEAWIKRRRDEVPPTDPAFYTVDCLLDDYRDHADTGTPLSVAVEGPGGE